MSYPTVGDSGIAITIKHFPFITVVRAQSTFSYSFIFIYVYRGISAYLKSSPEAPQ